MTANTGLAASRRHETGKGVARRLRAAGQVPAVLYGKDQEPISLTLDAREALSLFHSISVENTIVNVQIDDDKEVLETLVREIQMHPYRPDIVHVDFYCIERGVALEVEIPANYNGTPTGVRDGGVLEVILHEFRVKCIPSKIPESIEIDISHLDIGESIHVSEVPMDEGVELLTDPGQTACLVSAPRAEEEVEEEVEEGLEGVEGVEGAEGEAPEGGGSEREGDSDG
ncbi:MAG: 50S ribosomal protein L25 [Gemmatimonadetes bacterium]|nr:50S ribosomal protein L25 [Gemmatimonadota bacterium]MCH8810727.1 50S ribosomal protein L25 [Gemmatimonadota bacterium]